MQHSPSANPVESSATTRPHRPAQVIVALAVFSLASCSFFNRPPPSEVDIRRTLTCVEVHDGMRWTDLRQVWGEPTYLREGPDVNEAKGPFTRLYDEPTVLITVVSRKTQDADGKPAFEEAVVKVEACHERN